MSTKKSEKQKIIFLTLLMTEIKMVSVVLKRPQPTRSTVHMTKLISISLNLSTHKILETHTNNFSSMYASIFVDICKFLLGGVTLGRSGWSMSAHLGMHVYGKVVSYGTLGTSGRSTSPSNDLYTANLKNRLWGPIRTPGGPCEC